jgi:hypothetical protein
MATLILCASARADVGIVLDESLDTSVARITESGHSAVYFSRICPESPVKLRLCAPGEEGSVMSNYITLGEDEPFEWNIAPLSVFAYGVAHPEDRPLFSSSKVKYMLEERYMEKVIRDYCAGHACQTSKNAEWREMVSATSERTFYIFIVSTTVQQDLDLVEKFNYSANVDHFNGFARNCADFTKHVINSYFPHAAHRDILNDFGITSPKAIAHSFANYAHRHPGDDYRVLHFAQLPGTIKRSSECRNGTEQILRAKKLAAPVAFLAWPALPALPAAAASYFLIGRFNPEREFEQRATVHESEIALDLKAGKADDDPSWIGDLQREDAAERAAVVGTPQQWAAYHEAFDSIADEAVRDRIIPDRKSLQHVFKDFNKEGVSFADENGGLWLEVKEDGRSSTVGISPSNLLAHGSDSRLAYQVILAHVDAVLKSPARRRETLPNFKEAWNLLQQARALTALASKTYRFQR